MRFNEVLSKYDSELFFKEAFLLLTGKHPFEWQSRTFSRFIHDTHFDRHISLPTGTGKTSFMQIWLLALAWQSMHDNITIPRRLVWVVNRRVVVDQATAEAENIVSALKGSTDGLSQALAATIANLSTLDTEPHSPIGISTLRGQLADNEEWKLDPSRPAIIIGTVDMIGSRLLFSGYGDGRWKRPHHAGLLAHDALIVLDEAHLTPAFMSLLNGIAHEQSCAGKPLKPFQVLFLSASHRGDTASSGLDDKIDLRADLILAKRLDSYKKACIHLSPSKQVADKIAELSLKSEGSKERVLVYVVTPKMAKDVADKIEKSAKGRVRILTGTMRGFERDRLLDDTIFKSFFPDTRSPIEQTCYLVSTSAGEVGINIDADRMVCDMNWIDSLIQRFGRLNRFGNNKSTADIVVAVDDKGKPQPRDEKILDYLRSLPSDDKKSFSINPTALTANPPPPDIYSPIPHIAALDRMLLDKWSLTSIHSSQWPDRPEVGLWLHGATEDAPPEMWVAWRDDVEILTGAGLSDADLEKILTARPVMTHEKLKDKSQNIKKELECLASRGGSSNAILIRADGTFRRDSLSALMNDRLDYSTILLHTTIGGLSNGHLKIDSPDKVADVADAYSDGTRLRLVASLDGDNWKVKKLGNIEDEVFDISGQTFETLISEIENNTGLELAFDLPIGSDEEEESVDTSKHLLYFSASPLKLKGRTHATQSEPLDSHLSKVGKTVSGMAKNLSLDATLTDALTIASAWHDTGKNRPCWQRAIGNSEIDKPLAKSSQFRFDHRMNAFYRHEFGSLLDASADPRRASHAHRELILHLIATHHGHGRPVFEERALDRTVSTKKNQTAAHAQIVSFGRLQRRYGWWGLAYLEALVKSADALVSRSEPDE